MKVKINFIDSISIIYKKIIVRYKQLKKHPLVKYPVLGILKYLLLNILLRFKTKPIIWNWVNDVKYYLMIGDSCLISNCYFYIDDYEEVVDYYWDDKYDELMEEAEVQKKQKKLKNVFKDED